MLKNRPRSQALFEKAVSLLPGGVNSPVRAFSGLGVTPLIVHRGDKDEIIDIDGHRYVDYCLSWGALLHGHAHPAIVEAVNQRVALGSSFGLTTQEEIVVSQKIVEKIPIIEKIRFVSTGTEATMSAIRLARAYTSRPYIVKFSGHYHGHADSFLTQAGSGLAHFSLPSSKGVNEEFVRTTLVVPFNDKEAVERVFHTYRDQIAAIILEPIAANMGVIFPEAGFLEFLRHMTEKNHTLLIFDEVITGFRITESASSYFGVTPDLMCLGKIIGGGFPAAAFGGRREIMDELAPIGGVYQAGTLSGNPVAMAAGYQALCLTEAPHFYEVLEEKAKLITEPVCQFIQENNLPVFLNRVGSMFTLFFGMRKALSFEEVEKCNRDIFRRFFCFLLERGFYFSPSPFEAHFISSAHTQTHLLATREAILEFLKKEFLS